MYEDDPPAPAGAAGPLTIRARLGGLEPTRKRRVSGSIYESQTLGRLEFVRMPPDRSSFWFGQQFMPDSNYALQIVCEVDDDDLPGADHIACVVGLRRHQVKDAAACVPLINARLLEVGNPLTLHEEDLVLTAIYLRPRPLVDPCYQLEYHTAKAPELLFTVAFLRGVPRTVRVDCES